jgi:hypothetical protein
VSVPSSAVAADDIAAPAAAAAARVMRLSVLAILMPVDALCALCLLLLLDTLLPPSYSARDRCVCTD